MECCGVHSYKDFNKALEFKKYTNEEGDGQIIPEACCLLEDNSNRNTEQLAKLLFQPKDPNCVSVPTVTNSYMNQVILFIEICSRSLCFIISHNSCRQNNMHEKWL